MRSDRIVNNPFYVLGLPPTASRAEVERQGQKLLGMLEMGLKQAAQYATPLGKWPRTAEQVRQAMAELRDPDRRLLHELWASLPAAEVVSASPVAEPVKAGPEPWDAALSALGWRTR